MREIREVQIVICDTLVALVREDGFVIWSFENDQLKSNYGSIVEEIIANFDTYYGKKTLVPNTRVEIDGAPKVNLKRAAEQYLGKEAFSLQRALGWALEFFNANPVLPTENDTNMFIDSKEAMKQVKKMSKGSPVYTTYTTHGSKGKH